MIGVGLQAVGLVLWVAAAIFLGAWAQVSVGDALSGQWLAPVVALMVLLPFALVEKRLRGLVSGLSYSGVPGTPLPRRLVELPWIALASLLLIAVVGILEFGFVATTVAAFLVGCAWGGYRALRVQRKAPAAGGLFAAFIVLNVIWGGAQLLQFQAADVVAPFVGARFMTGLRNLQIEIAPPSNDQSIDVRVSFTMSRDLADYPVEEWAGLEKHSTSIPYTIPVIFLPQIEVGFDHKSGVSGRRDLGTTPLLLGYSIDGEPRDLQHGNAAQNLWFRRGNYIMDFRLPADHFAVREHRDYAGGLCLSERGLEDDFRNIRELTTDSRFSEKARIRVVTTEFSPLRRLFWHRERLSKAGETKRHELGAVEAPFSARDLAVLRLERYAHAARSECNPAERLESCVESGRNCTAPDLTVRIESARQVLDAGDTQQASRLR